MHYTRMVLTICCIFSSEISKYTVGRNMLLFGLHFVLDICLMFCYLDIYSCSFRTSGMIEFSYNEDNNYRINVLKLVHSRGFQTCAFPSGNAHVRELRDRFVGF